MAEPERHGARVLLNDALARGEGTDRAERAVTEHQEVPADLALLVIGVCPNVALAREASSDGQQETAQSTARAPKVPTGVSMFWQQHSMLE